MSGYDYCLGCGYNMAADGGYCLDCLVEADEQGVELDPQPKPGVVLWSAGAEFDAGEEMR